MASRGRNSLARDTPTRPTEQVSAIRRPVAVSARRAAGYRKFRDRRERAAPAFLPPLAWSASFSLVGCASFHLSPMSHHRTRHAPMCLEPEGRIHGKRCEHGIYDARSLHARRHPPSSVRRAVLWATLSHAVLVHVKARREEASHALPVTKARPAEPCRAAQRPGSSLPHNAVVSFRHAPPLWHSMAHCAAFSRLLITLARRRKATERAHMPPACTFYTRTAVNHRATRRGGASRARVHRAMRERIL